MWMLSAVVANCHFCWGDLARWLSPACYPAFVSPGKFLVDHFLAVRGTHVASMLQAVQVLSVLHTPGFLCPTEKGKLGASREGEEEVLDRVKRALWQAMLHVCLFHVHRSRGKTFLDVCSAICQNGTSCVVAKTCLNALRGGTAVTAAQESVSCSNYCNILPLLFPPCFLSTAALNFFSCVTC